MPACRSACPARPHFEKQIEIGVQARVGACVCVQASGLYLFPFNFSISLPPSLFVGGNHGTPLAPKWNLPCKHTRLCPWESHPDMKHFVACVKRLQRGHSYLLVPKKRENCENESAALCFSDVCFFFFKEERKSQTQSDSFLFVF